jgi:biopolymer transport protein ExbD
LKFKRQGHAREDVLVDITPLIDVVFLLLIFFMVSTTFTKENHLEIDLPEASGQVSPAQAKQIEVIIDAKGDYSVNNRALVNNKRDTLKKAVLKLSNGDTKLPFVITADAKTEHEYVVRVMDVAGQLGFVRLSITTQNAPADQ